MSANLEQWRQCIDTDRLIEESQFEIEGFPSDEDVLVRGHFARRAQAAVSLTEANFDPNAAYDEQPLPLAVTGVLSTGLSSFPVHLL